MHPVAFNLGSFTIHSYGVMMAVAFIAGLWTATRRGLRENFHPEKIYDLGPWLIGGGLLGARIFYVVSYWRESFAGRPLSEIFMLQHGGLVFYGGFIGATLAGIFAARRNKLPLWKLADVLAPSIALGNVFGRLGCFLNGCCYGRVCTLPWAVHYPLGHETYGLAVHPTQIYDSLMNLALYAVLEWQFRRKKFDGQIFALFLLAYACTRSITEYFRGDYSDAHVHDGLTPAHLVSLGIFAAGVVLWVVRNRKAAPKPEHGK